MSGLLRTLAPRRRRPADLMKALNESLSERKVEARYVSLLVLLWNPLDPADGDGERRVAAAAGVPQRRDHPARAWKACRWACSIRASMRS